jgi:hypothetical protein
MSVFRLISIVDLGVAGVIAVALFLPARVMIASNPSRSRSAAHDEQMGLLEARSIAHPEDGAIAAAASQALSTAGYRDWAVELPVAVSKLAMQSPSRWQALRAASIAHLDRFEAGPALEYAQYAVAACDIAGPEGCPSWDQTRLELFAKHLEAGVRSGINPKKDPAGFNAAGGAGVRSFRTTDRAGKNNPTLPATP